MSSIDQELVRGSYDEPTSLDPQIGMGNEIYIHRDLLEGLVSVDADGELAPAVAERWETADGLTYTFTLRRDARWSNGDPVTAHDFVFSWQRLVDPATASPYGWYLGAAGIAHAAAINRGEVQPESLGVAALDDHTLQVTLSEPTGYFVDMLTHTSTFPLPARTVRKHGNGWARPGKHVGNGPFQLAEWVVNERIVLESNPYYWDRESVKLQKVTFLPIRDAAAELKRYLAGELDITYQIPESQISRLREEFPDHLHLEPFLGTRFIWFNTRHQPLNDPRVRKALAYAIDRKTITQQVMGTGEVPSFTLTPPGYLGNSDFEAGWGQWTQVEREERARELYEQAGYSADNPLHIEMIGNGRISIALAAMWKRVLGVEATLGAAQEFKVYLKNLDEGNFQVATGTWWGDYIEPSTMLNLMLTGAGTNSSGYANRTFDALMNASKHEQDEKKRMALYQQAEEILAEDMPIAPLFQFTSARLAKPYVAGYRAHPLNHLSSKSLWIQGSKEQYPD
ncbi:peptide ABC transporter substrate-binding protein [Microbulbifer guangxiensis]|uniref:peptide ABC transporter substrate-binding protein n=1 Tax=Microbulbifer guangxiensis TaxID=2904249 RepID=UPI001F3707D0|nr:peptide ABC transporter substrate-binding protein [Microbulbifer guangxiensis]